MPTNPISKLSSADLRKAAALQARIEELQAQLANTLAGGSSPAPVSPKKARRKMSAAARQRLSQSAKARWKKAKAAGKSRL